MIKESKTINKKILWIALAILLGISIGVLSHKIFGKNVIYPDKVNHENPIEELVAKISILNENFTEDAFSDKTKYNLIGAIDCYKYQKDNMEEVKSLIDELYMKDNTYFQIETRKNEEKESLYVCFNSNCHFEKITSAEISDEAEYKIDLLFNEKAMHSLYKEDGKWKFTSPIIFCDEKK